MIDSPQREAIDVCKDSRQPERDEIDWVAQAWSRQAADDAPNVRVVKKIEASQRMTEAGQPVRLIPI